MQYFSFYVYFLLHHFLLNLVIVLISINLNNIDFFANKKYFYVYNNEKICSFS